MRLSVVLLFAIMLAGCAQRDSVSGAPESLVATTSRFEFHSNFWLNLNHYIYKMASGEGRTPIDSSQFVTVGGLPEDERALWDLAIGYYTAHHIDDNIRTDDTLFTFKRWVIDLPQDTALMSTEFDPEWLAVLNNLAPVYAERFWPEHDAQNRITLEEHLEIIRRIEDPVFDRLAELGRNAWPSEPIRVDLSYYSNWAGAYTTTRPVTHVVLTSVDIQPPGNWLEILFHEPSHGIIGGWSPLGAAIDSSAAAYGVEPPRQLWHGMLFYFSGRAVQDELSAMGRSHELYMMERNVFTHLHPLLLAHAEPYFSSEITLEEALDRIMAEHAAE